MVVERLQERGRSKGSLQPAIVLTTSGHILKIWGSKKRVEVTLGKEPHEQKN